MPLEHEDPPNVLFVLLDEMRPDALGCCGHPFVETPAIDRLARDGVRFENAYTNAPQCVPARAALQMSLYPHQNEVRNNNWYVEPERLPEAFTDYLEFNDRLRAVGYDEVRNVGKWHLPVTPEEAGFTGDVRFSDQKGATPFDLPEGADGDDVVYKLGDDGPIVGATHPGPVEDTYTAQGVSTAIDQLSDLEGDRPWMLRLSLDRPHTPVIPPEPYASMYEDDVSLPEIGPDDLGERPPIVQEDVVDSLTDAELRRLRARYFGLVTFVDEQLGRLFDHLEAEGIAEDVLTVVTADHGSAIGDRGRQTKGTVSTPETAGVPLIVHYPAGIDPDRPYDGPVQLMDVYPTILDAVGADVPGYAEGESLVPVLDGRRERIHDEIFLELTLGGDDRTARRHMETVRTEEWRYTRYPGVDQTELVDLVKDPEERRDCSDEHPDRATEFDRRLDEWLDRTPPIGTADPR